MRNPSKSLQDGFKILLGNHMRQRNLVEKLIRAPPEKRRELALDLSREVAQHYSMEYKVVYPQMLGTLDNGNALFYKALPQHKRIVGLASTLERVDPSDSLFDMTIKELDKEMHKHHQIEQKDIYSNMRQLLTEEDLDKLHRALDIAKNIAPESSFRVPL